MHDIEIVAQQFLYHAEPTDTAKGQSFKRHSTMPTNIENQDHIQCKDVSQQDQKRVKDVESSLFNWHNFHIHRTSRDTIETASAQKDEEPLLFAASRDASFSIAEDGATQVGTRGKSHPRIPEPDRPAKTDRLRSWSREPLWCRTSTFAPQLHNCDAHYPQLSEIWKTIQTMTAC